MARYRSLVFFDFIDPVRRTSAFDGEESGNGLATTVLDALTDAVSSRNMCARVLDVGWLCTHPRLAGCTPAVKDAVSAWWEKTLRQSVSPA
jgi:hypothetical protein